MKLKNDLLNSNKTFNWVYTLDNFQLQYFIVYNFQNIILRYINLANNLGKELILNF